MTSMIVASLILNIAVLFPVCTGFVLGAGWIDNAYGAATPARGILLSVYGVILILSVILLVFRNPKMVACLLMIQIIYKMLTVAAVGPSNPVVISNIVIALFHLATLFLIWQTLKG